MAVLFFNNGAIAPAAQNDSPKSSYLHHSSLKQLDFSNPSSNKNPARESAVPPRQEQAVTTPSPGQTLSYINAGKSADSLENRRRLKALHVMSAPVITATSHDLVINCQQLMQDNNVSHIVIINKENNPLAIVDAVDILAVRNPEMVFISSILTPEAIAVSEDTLVRDVALTFMKFKSSALAVVDAQHRLTGIISRSDLIGLLVSGPNQQIRV